MKKIIIIAAIVVAVAGIVALTVVRAQSGYTKVLTGKVVRGNLVSVVSGTGQIKPKGRGFAHVEEKVKSKMVDFDGWKEIDRFERDNSPSLRCRRKLTNVSSMVSIAQRKICTVTD